MIFREKAFVNSQAPRRLAEGLVLAFPLHSLLRRPSPVPLSPPGAPFFVLGPSFSLGPLRFIPPGPHSAWTLR